MKKIYAIMLPFCLLACMALPACGTQEKPQSSATESMPISSAAETNSAAPVSSQQNEDSAAEHAPSLAGGMESRQVQQTLPSGVLVNAVAAYPSAIDFSNLTAYAGTLHCFNEETVKAVMLEGDTVHKEESQEIADSTFPGALHYFYETERGAWLTVNGASMSFDTRTLGDITRYFYYHEDSDPYNGDVFLTGQELSFATQQQAYESLREKLDSLGVKISKRYDCFTLEHTLLQSEADRLYELFELDQFGDEKKPTYTADQDCYFFRFYGSVDGAPITTEANGISANGGYQGGVVIEAIYSAEGISSLYVASPYDVGGVEAQGPGLDLDAALGKLDEKYNSIILDGTYEVQDISFEYVPIADGSSVQVSLTPMWHFGVLHTYEYDTKDGSGGTVGLPVYEHIMLDALTGQEILTDLGGV